MTNRFRKVSLFPLFLIGFFVLWAVRATLLYRIDRLLPMSMVMPYGLLVKSVIWIGFIAVYARVTRQVQVGHWLCLTTRPSLGGLVLAAALSLAYLSFAAWDQCYPTVRKAHTRVWVEQTHKRLRLCETSHLGRDVD